MGKRSPLNHPSSAKKQKQYNWKSWKISPIFLIPVIILAAVLAAILELLVQVSNKPVSSSQFLSAWLSWYTKNSPKNVAQAIPSTTIFLNASIFKSGLLTFTTVSSIPPFYYFLWVYLPTIVFVLYGLLWETIDAEIKRVEPFYQASRPQGSLAKHSIFAEYISLPPFLSPIQAFRWRQWAVFFCSVS
jgi:hypothetical protein